MTILTNVSFQQVYGDILTTTNSGQGLSNTFKTVQDALGNSSPMSIAQNAINFTRVGSTFSIDSIDFTADISTLNSLGGITYTTVPNGFRLNRTYVNTSPYNALQTDCIISPDTTIGAYSIILPTPSPGNAGQIFIVSDEKGNSAANHIVITVQGGSTINGIGNATVANNYGSINFFSTGTNYLYFSLNEL